VRRDYRWFETRAAQIWQAAPGRSFLLVAPYGCDEAAAAAAVAAWTAENFRLPAYCSNHCPTLVRITPDGVTSSAHFVRRLCQQLTKRIQGEFVVEQDDYPSETLEALVDEAHAKGVYPILVIERFHTFARIADHDLLSVLSALRSCEHASQVTTLAISPIGYDTMRRQMASHLPFVNSAYGDNHDRAVMTPLSREEFVDEATSCGLKPRVAQRLFGTGGGPDTIYRTLIDVAIDGEEDILERCVSRLADRLDRFLDYTFAEPGYDREELLAHLALGCLRPVEEDFISAHLLFRFIGRRTHQGRIVSSTPILSRAILRRGRHRWHVFESCLNAVASGDYDTAGALATNADPTAPHLRAFCSIVDILVSLHTESDAGLLGIDWMRIRLAGEQLLKPEIPVGPHRPWVEMVTRWSRLVDREATRPGTGRPQLDTLTARAAEPDVYDLLVFSMSTYLGRVKRLAAPAARVRAVASLPESILQAFAAAQCGIDFRKAPDHLPTLDYDRFFGAKDSFRLPNPGSKMELVSLLVVVPTLMSDLLAPGRRPPALCDPALVCPLQQKLVDRLRNPNAHTVADFSLQDADFLVNLCAEWLDAMARLAGYEGAASLPAMVAAPSAKDLSILLYGGEDQPAVVCAASGA
jgi:hypothetical protein